MSEIKVKICKKHGKLKENQIHVKGKNKHGNPYYACNFCKKENAKKYYKNNFDNIKIKSADYHQKRKLDPEFKYKKRKWMHDYQKRKRLNEPDQVREKDRKNKLIWSARHREKINKSFQEMRNNLHPMYVKNYLKTHYGFSNPNDEIIHAKATLMLLRREIMKINFNQGRNKYVAKTRKYKRGTPCKFSEKTIIEGSTQEFVQSKNIEKINTNK